MALAEPKLRDAGQFAFRILFDELPKTANGSLIIFSLKAAPRDVKISSDTFRFAEPNVGRTIVDSRTLRRRLRCFAQLLEFVVTALEQLRLRLGVFLELGQSRFQRLDPLVAFAAGLTELATELNPDLVDTFLNRAQLALHLLHVCPRVGQRGAKTIDFALQIR